MVTVKSQLPVFPAPLVKEVVFFPLYILASFVEDKVFIGLWIYLWAFYSVPLIYISVFVTCQSGWLLSKSLQAINAEEGVEKREPSYTVGGNTN